MERAGGAAAGELGPAGGELGGERGEVGGGGGSRGIGESGCVSIYRMRGEEMGKFLFEGGADATAVDGGKAVEHEGIDAKGEGGGARG